MTDVRQSVDRSRILLLAAIAVLPTIGLLSLLLDVTLPFVGRIDVLLSWSVLLTGIILIVRARKTSFGNSGWTSLLQIAAAMIAASVISVAYRHSAADRVAEELQTAMSEQRILKAHQLAAQLSALRESATFRNQSITNVERTLRLAVRRLKREAESQPLTNSNVSAIGQRVSVLMQLDRYTEALDLLEPMVELRDAFVPALDAAGLCCQRLQRWQESLDYYTRARERCESLPPSAARMEATVSACRGAGFAARQLSDFPRAEAEYRAALGCDPTAEHHFLLARLHHDRLRTSEARHHLQQAMQLSPERYAEEGQRLLDTINMHHFGCLQQSTDGRRQ